MPNSSRDTTEIIRTVSAVEASLRQSVVQLKEDLGKHINDVRESVVRIEATCLPCREKVDRMDKSIYGENSGGLKEEQGKMRVDMTNKFDELWRRWKLLTAAMTLIWGGILAVIGIVLGK